MPNDKPQDFELVELLIKEASSVTASTSAQLEEDFKSFQARFQSFLDQIPKPSGASAAPEKEGFFINYFLAMFASLESTKLYEKLKLKGLHFKLVGEELYVMVETKKDKKQLFVFSESSDKKSEADLNKEIKENVGKSVKSKVTKVLIGREKNDEKKWNHRVLVRNQGDTGPILDDSFHKFPIENGEEPNLEDNISKLATGKMEDASKNIKEIIDRAYRLYSKLKEKDLVKNKDKEAAQHGFISGILMNFRYRYNLRLYLELLTGRGYSDIILLVRGAKRSWKAIPIVMELKAKGNKDNALVEAESYAKGLCSNKMRLLTKSKHAICVGVNLNKDNNEYFKISEAVEILSAQEPFIQSLIKAARSGQNDKDKAKGDINNLLGKIYYAFPSEQYARRYLSRFMFGQMSLVEEPEEVISIKGYIFDHSKPEVKNCLTTFIFVTNESGGKSKKVFVFHVQERPKTIGGIEQEDKDFSEYNSVSIQYSKNEKEKMDLKDDDEVTHVHLKGYQYGKGEKEQGKSPGTYYCVANLVILSHYKVKNYFKNISESQKEKTSSFEGKFLEYNTKELKSKFKEAIDYQQEKGGD